jgi:O-antigen ligase
MYLTYSRAAILSLFGLAVVIAWRVNRRLGQIVLVVGLGAGLALLPSYLALRGQATNVGVLEPGSLLVATDALRLQAWDSAVHMWLDQPVTGQGFLAYKQLADGYGDTVLSSPHNEWLRLFAEEGTIAGVAGLGFVATTMWWLMRRTGPVASGILAGAVGYVLMATFNNPLLFIQVSVIVFVGIGYGLARSVAPRISAPPADATGDAGAGHP